MSTPSLIYSNSGVLIGYGPAPSSSGGGDIAVKGGTLGGASYPGGDNTGSLFSFTPHGGNSSTSCATCGGGGSSSGQQADIFNPGGETRLCGKCLCTWLLAGLLLVALVLWAGSEDDE